jgi:periplasmic divalent cation tolerance protein
MEEGLVLEPTSTARVVITTVASAEEARRLGHALVEQRLAACATLLPSVHSIYRWNDKIESSDETMLVIKTTLDQLSLLEARLCEMHSYETPEILVLPVETGGRAYLDWLQASVRSD